MPNILPTLQGGTKQVLSSPSGIAAYLLYFFFHNPGDISTTFPNTLSFRKIEALYESDPGGMAEAIRRAYTNALKSYLPDVEFIVTVDVVPHDIHFTLQISVLSSAGESLLDATMITIDGDKVDITPA